MQHRTVLVCLNRERVGLTSSLGMAMVGIGGVDTGFASVHAWLFGRTQWHLTLHRRRRAHSDSIMAILDLVDVTKEGIAAALWRVVSPRISIADIRPRPDKTITDRYYLKLSVLTAIGVIFHSVGVQPLCTHKH
jgi:hypothetical protein